jgi:hypothetical protein
LRAGESRLSGGHFDEIEFSNFNAAAVVLLRARSGLRRGPRGKIFVR